MILAPPRTVLQSVAAPPTKWVGASPANYKPTRNGIVPEILVMHTMVGTVAGCDAWFNDPAARASTLCAIPRRDGEPIHLYLRPEWSPYANGQRVGYCTHPFTLPPHPNAILNANDYSHGFEWEDLSKPGLEPTAWQWQVGVQFAAYLFVTQFLINGATDVAVDEIHIAQHNQFDSRERAGCPGWPADRLAHFRSDVRGLVYAPEPTPPAPGPTPPAPTPTDPRRAALIAELRGQYQAAIDNRRRLELFAGQEAYAFQQQATNAADKLRALGEPVS